MAEREGFEPSIPCGIHTFQACAFDHSATSPKSFNTTRPCRLTPLRGVAERSGLFGAVRLTPSGPASLRSAVRHGVAVSSNLDTLRYTHFPGVRLRPLGHLSGIWNFGARRVAQFGVLRNVWTVLGDIYLAPSNEIASRASGRFRSTFLNTRIGESLVRSKIKISKE